MFSNSLNIELICMLQLINYYYYDSLLSPLFTYRCFILSRHSWSALDGPGVANNIIQTELTTQRTADWLRSWGGDGVTQHLLLTLSAVQQSGCKFRTEQWKSQNKVNQKNYYFDYYNSTIIYLWVLCTVCRKSE